MIRKILLSIQFIHFTFRDKPYDFMKFSLEEQNFSKNFCKDYNSLK